MLHLTETGTGPLLLCLHGIGGSAQTFRPQLDALASDWRVMAWDAPGYADSPDPESYPGMEGYLDAIGQVLDRAGEHRAVLLGMSWGGVLAMQFTLRHPERVRALILGDSTRGSGQTLQQAVAMRSRATELAEVGPLEFASRRAPRLVACREMRGPVAEAMAASIRLPGYGYAAEVMASTNLAPRLSRISVPTLVIYGSADVVTGRTESEAIAAAIPGARLAVVPGAGHLANQELPERFNTEVRTFLHTIGDSDEARQLASPEAAQ